LPIFLLFKVIDQQSIFIEGFFTHRSAENEERLRKETDSGEYVILQAVVTH
jgi:hypothetical protein